MLHQQFHLSPQNLHKPLLMELSMSQCKLLARFCATCAPLTPLGPLGRSGLNPRGLLPITTWQIGVTHYPAFGNHRYVHIVVDTCSAFVDAVAMAGEKASHFIKAMKSTMLVMGASWALKTDNGAAYSYQLCITFLFLWRIIHFFGIAYNPQGQAILERVNP